MTKIQRMNEEIEMVIKRYGYVIVEGTNVNKPIKLDTIQQPSMSDLTEGKETGSYLFQFTRIKEK